MNDQEFIKLLDKHRDEQASPLQFQPAIEFLMDSRFCKSLDEIIHSCGAGWERKKAVAELWESLPNETGLYMFVWRPEFSFRFAAGPASEQVSWVLYVGKAGGEVGIKSTLKSRYQSEYSKYVGKDATCLWDDVIPTDREQRLGRFLTLRPLEYWFLSLANDRNIPLFERRLIRLLRPPLNRQHGTKIRPGKPGPAF